MNACVNKYVFLLNHQSDRPQHDKKFFCLFVKKPALLT